MNHLLSIIILVTSCSSAFCQDKPDGNWKLFGGNEPVKSELNVVDTFQTSQVFSDTLQVMHERIGYIEIVQDKRIKELLERNARINGDKNSISGYRIQLFSGSGANVKAKANKFRSDFIRAHEETPVYVSFDVPIWKTRVGDYRTKLEAEKFLLNIQVEFPNSFVVKDQIEYPDL
jgi:hypothetical protein